MKNYIEYFERGGNTELKPFKRFWSKILSPEKDTFNIQNPSILGGSYQTIKQLYTNSKDEPETLYTWAILKSPNLVWFANNSNVVKLPAGGWAIRTNSSLRNNNIPTVVL